VSGSSSPHGVYLLDVNEILRAAEEGNMCPPRATEGFTDPIIARPADGLTARSVACREILHSA
jgi:hypothetical protein